VDAKNKFLLFSASLVPAATLHGALYRSDCEIHPVCLQTQPEQLHTHNEGAPYVLGTATHTGTSGGGVTGSAAMIEGGDVVAGIGDTTQMPPADAWDHWRDDAIEEA
jgi:hypothetical protein